ncbi:MAG: hypothetical protein JNK29_13405, partial [Anaerolineales bacterium]|nr:hypothetical protein [Anaerolineales bacterium]
LFGLTPAQARESAEWRVRANTTVDGITAGASRDVAADWASLEADLRACYRSLRRAASEAAPARGR